MARVQLATTLVAIFVLTLVSQTLRADVTTCNPHPAYSYDDGSNGTVNVGAVTCHDGGGGSEASSIWNYLRSGEDLAANFSFADLATGLAMGIGYGVLPTTSDGLEAPENKKSEPVNGDGEFTTDETDLSFPGFGLPYQFTRTYRSGVQYAGVLGFGWDHNYNQMILGSRGPAPIIPDTPLQRLTKGFPLYHTGAMQDIMFDEVRASADYPSGEIYFYYSSDPRLSAYQLTFSTASQQWTLTNLETGVISTFIHLNGYANLQTVTGPTGGQTQVFWEEFPDGKPRVSKVTDTTGRTIVYNYQNGFLKCLSMSFAGCTNPLVSFVINSTDSTAADYGELTQVRKGNDSTGISYQYHHGALPVTWLPSAQIDPVCNGLCVDGTDSTCPDSVDMCVNMASQSLDVDSNGNIDYSRCRAFCLTLCIDSCAPPKPNQQSCLSNCATSCPYTCNDATTYTGPHGDDGYYQQCWQRFAQKLPFCQAGLGGNTQGCLDSCKSYYAPPSGVTYAIGQPIDLNHNLELMTDGAGRTILHNTYDPDPSHVSFDKVIDQQWGDSQHVIFEYHDLALEKQYTGPLAPSIPNQLLDTIDSFHSTALCSCDAAGNCAAPFDDTGSQTQSQSPKYATVTTDIHGVRTVQYFGAGHFILREVNLENGETKNYNYAKGRLIGAQEASGARTCSVLDTVGHPIQINRLPASGYPGDQTSIQQVFSWNGALLSQYSEDSSSSSSVSYQRLSDGRPYQINVAVDSATTQTTTLAYNGTFYPSSIAKNGTITQYNAYDQNGAAPQVVITDVNGPSPLVRYRTYDPTWGAVTFDALYDGSSDRGSSQTTYDTAGRMSTRTRHLLLNDAGFKTTYIYNAAQQPSSVSDPKQTSLPIYDTNNNLINLMEWPTQPGDQTIGRRTCHHYDIDGRLIETIRPEGDSLIYHYDSSGRVSYVEKGYNPVQQSGNWASGCSFEHSPPPGDPGLETIVAYSYRQGGFLQSFTQNGIQYQVTTDGFGRTIETIDPIGRRERRGLDHRGRLVWLARFDADPNVPPYAKPEGGEPGLVAMTEYSYDNLGRTTSTTRWRFENDGLDTRITTTTQYLDDQRKVVIQDAPDRTIQLTYDGVGRLVSRVEPDGSSTTITYSNNGAHSSTTTQTTSGNIVTERDFDALELETSSVVNGQQVFLEPHSFDGTALYTYKTAEGKRTFAYDAFGRRTQSRLLVSLGGHGGRESVTQTAYDGDNRVVSITDDNGAATTSVYDGLDRQMSRIDSLTRTSTYRYVPGSKRLAEADLASGNRQTFVYTPAGELALETTNVPGIPIDLTRSFTYTPLGQIQTATISGGTTIENTTTLQYDSLGNLSSDANSLVPHSVYDGREPYGRWRWFAVNNYWINEPYDVLRRKLGTSIFGVGSEDLQEFGNGAAGVGLPVDIYFPFTGMHETYSVDAQGKRIGVDATNQWGSLIISQHDSEEGDSIVRARRRQMATNTYVGGTTPFVLSEPVTDIFNVDLAGRVTDENLNVAGVAQFPTQVTDSDIQGYLGVPAARSYQLDGVANPVSFSKTGATFTQSFNGMNQITATTAASSVPAYDASDNLTQLNVEGNPEVYTYDPFGHVTSITAPAGDSVQITYDALGRRILENDGGSLNYLVWEGNQLIEHGSDATSYCIENYGDGLDQHTSAFCYGSDGSHFNYFYITAPDGSILAVTDGWYYPTESYSYSAFGEVTIQDASGQIIPASVSGNRFMFQGQMLDPWNGTYSMRAREYHPRLGRFLSTDPIGLGGGINLYAFAGGNPLAFTDPWGSSRRKLGGINDPNSMPMAVIAGLLKAPLGLLALAGPGNNQDINNQIGNLLNYPIEGPVAGMTDMWASFYTGVALDASTLVLDPELLSSVATSAVAESTGTGTGTGTATFTFRGDPTPADVAFTEGLSAKGTSTDLLAHTLDSSNPPSAFISTSKSADVAAAFDSTNIYVVRPTEGIDVNSALGELSPFPGEHEVAIPWRIEPSDIRAVTLPQDGLSRLNPQWKP